MVRAAMSAERDVSVAREPGREHVGGMPNPSRNLGLGWFLKHAALAAAVGATAMPVAAMRIVLTNDDGFESGSIQAVYSALRSAGHEVILSAPLRDRSGTSAQLGALSNIPRTTSPSPGGRIAAGAPGVGPTGVAPDQYYVDSTPAAAALYGIDVVARSKWGAPPDLVISGPNLGTNLGLITPHSGTVGSVITALNRGIPGIAVSAANFDAATAPLLAAIVLRVVASVETAGRVMLPVGVGLNVNIPALGRDRTAASYRYAFTRIGFVANTGIRFAANPAELRAATGATSAAVTVPSDDRGVLAAPSFVPPVDSDPHSETNAFADGNTVTISAIQGTFQASDDRATQVLAQMRDLFNSARSLSNPKLLNASARGWVGAGNAVQVAGFVVSGATAKTYLIRASGPALAQFGVTDALADPSVELFDRENRLVKANDNWSDDAAPSAALAAAAARAGAFAWPPGSNDAAMLVALAPGTYTVVVKGAGESAGITLIEIFDVNVD